jgi:hypothetical protein
MSFSLVEGKRQQGELQVEVLVGTSPHSEGSLSLLVEHSHSETNGLLEADTQNQVLCQMEKRVEK